MQGSRIREVGTADWLVGLKARHKVCLFCRPAWEIPGRDRQGRGIYAVKPIQL